ncbi:MAG: ATP-binding cassette domain-containing protein, partial [Clostridium sp.]|nr:ATP-binding cassette domain-containing protein [Clostridium sp.]
MGLLGYSGSGKTMTLKMIAGIITPDKGKIVLNGRTLFDSNAGINLKPQQRNVGLMFQSYALFNTMSVYDNIAIGMRKAKQEKAHEISKWLKLLELEELKDRKPKMLSGG